jgi:hypothetical protein
VNVVTAVMMISKVRSQMELRFEAGKLCEWRPGAWRRTSRPLGRGRINPAAANGSLHQINVKGFASRPDDSKSSSFAAFLELSKIGPTLDINLVPRGGPPTGLMLTDHCYKSFPQNQGMDLTSQDLVNPSHNFGGLGSSPRRMNR